MIETRGLVAAVEAADAAAKAASVRLLGIKKTHIVGCHHRTLQLLSQIYRSVQMGLISLSSRAM